MNQKTVLYEEHKALGAKMIDFGGWEMPVLYTNLTQEHHTVRQHAGIFDIGHMGIVAIEGTDALDFVQYLTTNDASVLEVGQIQYSMLCNPQGGVIDDILVYRLPDRYMFVVNASNTKKVLYWLDKNSRDDVTVTHLNPSWSMLAVQGPDSEDILNRIVDTDLTALKYYRFAQGSILGKKAIISRTGYTGEDGFEIIVKKDEIKIVWKYCIENGIEPCGLGARDTLRIEAGMPLYGNELTETTTPASSHLRWAIKLTKPSFIGKEALAQELENGVQQKLMGIEMLDKAIPRHGYRLQDGGTVTSGTFSPTLQKPIGIVLLEADKALPDTIVEVQVRDKYHQARLVNLPFYKRTTEKRR